MSRKYLLWKLVFLLSVVGFITTADSGTERNQLSGLFAKYGAKPYFLPQTIKAGNLAPTYRIDYVLSDIEKMGLNTVNIPVLVKVSGVASNEMAIDEASKEKAIHLLQRLNRDKVHVILEPFPWIADGAIGETEWNPAEHHLFFNKWRTEILQQLLQELTVPFQADAITVGSNLVHLEADTAEWIDTIQFVRERYSGLVTYRTNWWYTAGWEPDTVRRYETKLNNPLFSKLDFISVSAYFELTNHQPTIENVAQALYDSQINGRKQNVYQEVKNFYDRWQKPVYFGELGFPRRHGAASHPWNPQVSELDNPSEQAAGFAAYQKVFGREQWMLGFGVFAIGIREESSAYYPGEETIGVIKSW